MVLLTLELRGGARSERNAAGGSVGWQHSEANFQAARFGNAPRLVWAAKLVWKQKIKLLRFSRGAGESRYFLAVFQDLCLFFSLASYYNH